MISQKNQKQTNIQHLFTSLLVKWHKTENLRNFPWKGEKNPYFVWLSEIILQQTRSEQGLPYYQKFISHYPKITDLANSSLDKVLRDWQGLGYYSRARNLHETAKHISENLGGIFPKTYDEIIKLKGVGEYTAAAISSFAYNEAKAVVDGNVIRVLARIFGIEMPFDTTDGKKKFRELAQELLDEKNPAHYNQAIMDFGATVCAPKPNCEDCFFQQKCVAFNNDLISELPVKSKKIAIKNRFFYYFLMEEKNKIALHQRTEKDIWRELWELPMIEIAKANLKEVETLLGGKLTVVSEHTQTLSHQKIHSFFIEINAEKNHTSTSSAQAFFAPKNILFVPKKNLAEYAFPKTVHLFLSEKRLL